MKNREHILAEFQNVPENTLIMAGKLYREKFAEQMSEAAFMQAISRLAKSGEIERISKGIYCRPKKSRFGTILPSDQEIVDLFIRHNNGVIVGYGLYNSLGLTTQVSRRLNAYSSLVDEQLKQIGHVTVQKYDLEYTDEAKAVIRLMELLHHYREIQDINYSAFLRNTEALSRQYTQGAFEAVQKAIGYPKRTVAFLREALNYYQVPNNLNKYLSSLSNYRIPKMEELYEAAQQSR